MVLAALCSRGGRRTAGRDERLWRSVRQQRGGDAEEAEDGVNGRARLERKTSRGTLSSIAGCRPRGTLESPLCALNALTASPVDIASLNSRTDALTVCTYYLAGIVAAVAAVIGLFGLFWYVRETRKLRQISNRQAEIASEQIESLARPCVLIMEDADQLRAFQDRNLILKNWHWPSPEHTVASKEVV